MPRIGASGTRNATTLLRGDNTWQPIADISGESACGTPNVQTFNANGTWTKPSCGVLVKAECWGGGGGGYSVAYIPPSALRPSGDGCRNTGSRRGRRGFVVRLLSHCVWRGGRNDTG